MDIFSPTTKQAHTILITIEISVSFGFFCYHKDYLIKGIWARLLTLFFEIATSEFNLSIKSSLRGKSKLSPLKIK